MFIPVCIQNQIQLYNIHPVAEIFKPYINHYNRGKIIRYGDIHTPWYAKVTQSCLTFCVRSYKNENFSHMFFYLRKYQITMKRKFIH